MIGQRNKADGGRSVWMGNYAPSITTQELLGCTVTSLFGLMLVNTLACIWISIYKAQSVDGAGQLLQAKSGTHTGVCAAHQENLFESGKTAPNLPNNACLKESVVHGDFFVELDAKGTGETSWNKACLRNTPGNCLPADRLHDVEGYPMMHFAGEQISSVKKPVCVFDGALYRDALPLNYSFLPGEGNEPSPFSVTRHGNGMPQSGSTGVINCLLLRVTGASALHLNCDWHLLSEGSKSRGLRYVSDRGWLLEKTHEGSWRIKVGLFSEEVVAYSHAKSEFPGDSGWWSRSDLHNRLVHEQQQLVRGRDQWIEERMLNVECVRSVPAHIEASGGLNNCSPEITTSADDVLTKIIAKHISSIQGVPSEEIPCVVCSPVVPDKQRDLLFGLCGAISVACEKDDTNASSIRANQLVYTFFRISGRPPRTEAFAAAASVLFRIVREVFSTSMLRSCSQRKFGTNSLAHRASFGLSKSFDTSRRLALLRKCERLNVTATGVADAVSCTGAFSRVREKWLVSDDQSLFFKLSMDGRRVFLVVSEEGVICTSDHITSIIMAGVPMPIFQKGPFGARTVRQSYLGSGNGLGGNVHLHMNRTLPVGICHELNVRGFSHALATLNGRWLLGINGGGEMSYVRSPTRIGVAVKASASEFNGYALPFAGNQTVKNDATSRGRTEPTGLLYMYYSKRLGMWVIGPQTLGDIEPLKSRHRLDMTEEIVVAVCPRCAPAASPSGVWTSVDPSTGSLTLNLVQLDCFISLPG